MNYIAKINNDEEFILVDFSPTAFNTQMKLDLVTDDLHQVKELFGEDFLLQILIGERLVGEYTCFNGYNSITVKPSVYVESLGEFVDILQVSLTKKNLVDQVDELYKKVNNVVDTEIMTLEEYKEYKLQQISDVCQADIFAGKDIEFPDGIIATFSFNLQDQQDLKALFDLATQMPQYRYPWHANGEDCRLYYGVDIIRIYSELQAKLLYTTTYCNALNQMIRTAETKEEIDTYDYGCEIQEPYLTNMAEILGEMKDIFDAIKARYGIDQEESESEEDPEENEEPEEDNDNNEE